MKILINGLKASVIIIIGSIVFTMIFGVDHITAWKSLIEGTVIQEYYGAFFTIVVALLALIAVLLIKRNKRKNAKH